MRPCSLWWLILGCAPLLSGWLAGASPLGAQEPAAALSDLRAIRTGDAVPRDVREMYDRGLQYLANSQQESGSWSGGETGPGVTGLALLALLASGEDPNFGLYSAPIRRASSGCGGWSSPSTFAGPPRRPASTQECSIGSRR